MKNGAHTARCSPPPVRVGTGAPIDLAELAIWSAAVPRSRTRNGSGSMCQNRRIPSAMRRRVLGFRGRLRWARGVPAIDQSITSRAARHGLRVGPYSSAVGRSAWDGVGQRGLRPRVATRKNRVRVVAPP
jgi:hypothetical protein